MGYLQRKTWLGLRDTKLRQNMNHGLGIISVLGEPTPKSQAWQSTQVFVIAAVVFGRGALLAFISLAWRSRGKKYPPKMSLLSIWVIALVKIKLRGGGSQTKPSRITNLESRKKVERNGTRSQRTNRTQHERRDKHLEKQTKQQHTSGEW